MKDFVYAVRVLRRNPGFSVVSILSLALAVGANTAIFSLIDSLVWRKLPVVSPDNLFALDNFDEGGVSRPFSYRMFEELSRTQQVFSQLIAWTDPLLNVDGEIDTTEQVGGVLVSGNFFPVLGIRPLIGRLITEADAQASQSSVAVISYRFWRRFSHNINLVGQTIRVNGVATTVIGVTPPEFFGLEVGISSDVFMPISARPLLFPSSPPLESPNLLFLEIMGRLKDKVSLEQAGASLRILWPRVLESVIPPKYSGRQRTSFLSQRIGLTSASTGISSVRQQFAQPLFIVLAGAAIVLIVTSFNIAILLLARGAVRQREIALRLAVGAGRLRLVQQLLTESILLGLTGGISGYLVARWASAWTLGFLSFGVLPVYLDLHLDFRVLAFGIAVSLLISVLFGLFPAFYVTRADPGEILRAGVQDVGLRHRRWGLTGMLVVFEVGLSVLLLILAGLFIRSLQNLNRWDLGFRPDRILLVRLAPKGRAYRDVSLPAYYKELLQTVSAISGVESTSLIHPPPLTPIDLTEPVFVEGSSHANSSEEPAVLINYAAPGFFTTLGIPLLQGRDFIFLDTDNTQKVAVINEALTKHFFPTGTAVGNHIRVGKNREDVEIVGVVRNSAYRDIQETVPHAIFLSCFQYPRRMGYFTLVVRNAHNAERLAVAVSREVQALGVESSQIVTTLSERVDQLLARHRLLAKLSSLFGVVASLLVCIGLYGVVAYTTSQRTREIGIQMALGAQGKRICWMIVRETLPLTLAGLVFGLTAATAVSRLMASILFGLKPTDTVTLVSVSVLAVTISAFSAFLPAVRAARMEPTVALRYE